MVEHEPITTKQESEWLELGSAGRPPEDAVAEISPGEGLYPSLYKYLYGIQTSGLIAGVGVGVLDAQAKRLTVYHFFATKPIRRSAAFQQLMREGSEANVQLNSYGDVGFSYKFIDDLSEVEREWRESGRRFRAAVK